MNVHFVSELINMEIKKVFNKFTQTENWCGDFSFYAGYYAEKNAIIVFAACFLPDSDCENYNYVMENLFL